MKKIIISVTLLLLLTGCYQKQDVIKQSSITLSTEKQNIYKNQIKEFLDMKSWDFDENMLYSIINIPSGVKNTYYEEIIEKSKDCGLDLDNHLGNDAIEVQVKLKYPTGDVGGTAYFIFAQDNIVGGYYLCGNYIYSLNEKEVFKKKIEWQNIENTKINYKYQETKVDIKENLIYCGRYNDIQSYLFSYSGNKLRMLYLDKGKLMLNREISLDGLELIDMFFKDIDNDGNSELGLLVTDKEGQDDDKISKLIVYDIEDGLKQKYSMDFDKLMISVDTDGQNIIVTSNSSIQMYSFQKSKMIKTYLNTKLGGRIKVDNFDGTDNFKYILAHSNGKDIYIFENNKNDLEEIWRTYNNDVKYTSNIQIGDLNHDGVKEIYINDINGNIRKIILSQNGFIETNEIIKGHKYFIGDFNGDNKFEFFDSYTLQKTKQYCTIYKY